MADLPFYIFISVLGIATITLIIAVMMKPPTPPRPRNRGEVLLRCTPTSWVIDVTLCKKGDGPLLNVGDRFRYHYLDDIRPSEELYIKRIYIRQSLDIVGTYIVFNYVNSDRQFVDFEYDIIHSLIDSGNLVLMDRISDIKPKKEIVKHRFK